MKYFMFLSAAFLLFTSCKKEETLLPVKTLDQTVYGRWLLEKESFVESTYTRSTRFGEYEKGIVIFDDNTMIERSDGGICIGEFCLTENYYGTYAYQASDNSINVNVVNYGGPQSYKLTIMDVSTEKLVVKKSQ